MSYNFDINLSRNDWEVRVDTNRNYGYFEFVGDDERHYVEGGLWFERTSSGQLTLQDFDGVFSLPKIVADLLRESKIEVGTDFV